MPHRPCEPRGDFILYAPNDRRVPRHCHTIRKAEIQRVNTLYRRAPKLSVIVPTFNERDNVVALTERIGNCLRDGAWEIVYVDDDSPDGTAELVRQLAPRILEFAACKDSVAADCRRPASKECWRVPRRIWQSLTVICSTTNGCFRICWRNSNRVRQTWWSAAVTRSAAVPASGAAARVRLSRFGTRFSRMLVPETLTDPMSGFFMLRRSVFEAAVRKLSNIGTKILMDLVCLFPETLLFKELPYTFRLRHAGESKLDSLTAWEYAMLVLDKMFGHIVPVRFVAFCIVGALGVAVHFSILSCCTLSIRDFWWDRRSRRFAQ